MEKIMYWSKAKVNSSLARFENFLEKRMKANLMPHIKVADSCLVPFSRTSSWNMHMIWSKMAFFQLDEKTKH
jgi:hypothetical protein